MLSNPLFKMFNSSLFFLFQNILQVSNKILANVTILKFTNLYNSIWNKNPLKSLPVLTFFRYILFSVLLLNIYCLMFIFK